MSERRVYFVGDKLTIRSINLKAKANLDWLKEKQSKPGNPAEYLRKFRIKAGLESEDKARRLKYLV